MIGAAAGGQRAEVQLHLQAMMCKLKRAGEHIASKG